MPITDSPLRYPGGKTKLYHLVRPILHENVGVNSIYVEPFAGGAGLALKLLFRGDVASLVLNDIDENIYAFWHSCLNNTEAMCRLVYDCKPSITEWDRQHNIYINSEQHTMLERGFATLFLNRCNVSGVICGGPIGGRQQDSTYLINARYNPDGLVKKIQRIGAHRDDIRFYNMDATYFLKTIVAELPIGETFINIDPPYVKKGPMLYRNSFTEEDHKKLSILIKSLAHKWITTYDKCDLIRRLYGDMRICDLVLTYSAGNSKQGEELMILSNNLRIASDSSMEGKV